jgi:hypothetical protein
METEDFVIHHLCLTHENKFPSVNKAKSNEVSVLDLPTPKYKVH